MKILEKDLKQIVWEADTDELRHRGFPIVSRRRIKDFKVGNYGVADILFVRREDNNVYLSLYVFKEGKLGISAFLEGVSLKKGVERYLKKRYGGAHSGPLFFSINIFLVGNDIDKSGSLCYLSGDPLYEIQFIKYSLGISGLSFKEFGDHNLTDEGF